MQTKYVVQLGEAGPIPMDMNTLTFGLLELVKCEGKKREEDIMSTFYFFNYF